jgi:TPR repeat protein
MYYQGRGVSQCDSLAVKWLRLAADQEHANALKTLDMLLNNKK